MSSVYLPLQMTGSRLTCVNESNFVAQYTQVCILKPMRRKLSQRTTLFERLLFYVVLSKIYSFYLYVIFPCVQRNIKTGSFYFTVSYLSLLSFWFICSQLLQQPILYAHKQEFTFSHQRSNDCARVRQATTSETVVPPSELHKNNSLIKPYSKQLLFTSEPLISMTILDRDQS